MFEIANDCEILVEKFSKSECLSFADFVREWKASHFESIFWYVEFEHPKIIFTFLSFYLIYAITLPLKNLSYVVEGVRTNCNFLQVNC